MNPPNQPEPSIELIHDPQSEPFRQRSVDVSRPRMGFVEGTRPHFSDETAGLLRSRLQAATLVLSILLALGLRR